jgi:hypothetical protein
MNKTINPEMRSTYFNNYDNFYKRVLPNKAIEYVSKNYFNKDFTRKSNVDDGVILDNIHKDIILLQIKELLAC